MRKYQISNTISGSNLGTYTADTKAGALDAMARDAGYADYAAACVTAPVEDGEIAVLPVLDGWGEEEGWLDSASLDLLEEAKSMGLSARVVSDVKGGRYFVAISRCAGDAAEGHSRWAYGPVYSSKEAALSAGWTGLCTCGVETDGLNFCRRIVRAVSS